MNAKTYATHTNHGPTWFKVELQQPDGRWTDPRSAFRCRTFAFATDADEFAMALRDIGVGCPMRIVECNVFGGRL